jgi:hypothetical protein
VLRRESVCFQTFVGFRSRIGEVTPTNHKQNSNSRSIRFQ